VQWRTEQRPVFTEEQVEATRRELVAIAEATRQYPSTVETKIAKMRQRTQTVVIEQCTGCGQW
jgi:hypothetical protein